jgi:hypothetical protein
MESSTSIPSIKFHDVIPRRRHKFTVAMWLLLFCMHLLVTAVGARMLRAASLFCPTWHVRVPKKYILRLFLIKILMRASALHFRDSSFLIYIAPTDMDKNLVCGAEGRTHIRCVLEWNAVKYSESLVVCWKPTEIPQKYIASMFIKILQKFKNIKLTSHIFLELWSIKFYYITFLEYP